MGKVKLYGMAVYAAYDQLTGLGLEDLGVPGFGMPVAEAGTVQ